MESAGRSHETRDEEAGAPAEGREGGGHEQSAPPPGGREQSADAPGGQGGPEGPGPGGGNVDAPADGSAPLLSREDSQEFERRWEGVQVAFVDEPRSAVQQADGLVEEVVRRLTDVFGEERRNLEGQWDRGEEVSTEDLRVALQRYRSFFNRLLSTRGG